MLDYLRPQKLTHFLCSPLQFGSQLPIELHYAGASEMPTAARKVLKSARVKLVNLANLLEVCGWRDMLPLLPRALEDLVRWPYSGALCSLVVRVRQRYWQALMAPGLTRWVRASLHGLRPWVL